MTIGFDKMAKAIAAFAAVAVLVPAAANAQTVDGDTSDGAYMTIGTWTQADTGFGDHGITELKIATDGTNVYFAVTGEAESNGNAIIIVFGHDNATGVASGTPLPMGSDGFSPFNAFFPTLDFEADYGVRLGSGSPDSFVSIVDYTATPSPTVPDTFLGQVASNGTNFAVSGGAFDLTEFAYNDTGMLSSNTGVEGFEIAIPLAAIGATSTSVFEAFAVYSNGGGDFLSANTLPEITGQSGTNLGGNPDFTAIGGNQFGTFTLPVELSAFTLE